MDDRRDLKAEAGEGQEAPAARQLRLFETWPALSLEVDDDPQHASRADSNWHGSLLQRLLWTRTASRSSVQLRTDLVCFGHDFSDRLDLLLTGLRFLKVAHLSHVFSTPLIDLSACGIPQDVRRYVLFVPPALHHHHDVALRERIQDFLVALTLSQQQLRLCLRRWMQLLPQLTGAPASVW